MKRKTLKLVACAAITALTLSVTACGGDDAKTADSAEVEDTVEATEPEAEAESEAEADVAEAEADVESAEDEVASASTGAYTTLEDYYNDPSVKSILDSMFASIAEDGMSADLEVKGNEFTVIIKIEDSSMIVDGLGEALDAALESQADTFKEQVKQFDEVVEEEGACTVIMRYTDPDDNVLAEKAFTAN
ncbi:MAG: DUF4854 domain-containing protein [Lachnospiraceae bacterium]|nr:DUF4854 domain-containing protein [Lachnospiraceae bacterium]